jgi:hypothetical protein
MAHHLLAKVIHEKVVAVAPIVGVSLGSWTDKAKWHVVFKAEATDAEKTAAATAITDFDIAAEEAILEAETPSMI